MPSPPADDAYAPRGDAPVDHGQAGAPGAQPVMWTPPPRPQRVAVIGSGVAGLTAAHVIAKSAHVTLYEADDRLGGHADTHLVTEGYGPRAQTLAIDTGFIVHNRRTYPTLLRLFEELDVDTQESDMSMSVTDEITGLEWAGAMGIRGLFPTWSHLSRTDYLWMLTEIPRFHRKARRLLANPNADEVTMRTFLRNGGFSTYFVRHFMEPLIAAVWSTDPTQSLDYPARYLFAFLRNHGMLSVFGSPRWRTVTGGSREYVERVAKGLPEIRLGTRVVSVLETRSGVEVTDAMANTSFYDSVVIATHPHQALAMLAMPTPDQQDVLRAMRYSTNKALLHTDTRLLPEARNARASWNFLRPAQVTAGVTVTYDLTRLQQLPTDIRYLVTLGGEELVDPRYVIAEMEYEHPRYTPASVAAQRRLPQINSTRIAFAGAYHGWGFHEDGARSGLVAAEHLGFAWPESAPDAGYAEHGGGLHSVRPHAGQHLLDRAAPEDTPDVRQGILYRTRIRHVRRRPFERSFENWSYTWLVDLDHLPDHGVLGRFLARDHLGDPRSSIRENVERFLTGQGVRFRGGQILMATSARAFGYCFNPITVFWCLDDQGRQAATVVEVHNTYGDRHAYLVHPDEQGRATTPKQMYVSPFHGTDGSYELSVPLPGRRLTVSVSLRTDDGALFTASMAGARSRPEAWRAAPTAIRSALSIRAHGIWLWARRLPVQPRPVHHQEQVS